MSWSFTAQSRAIHPAGQHAGETPDQRGGAGVYLTDGIELYRSLGAIGPGPCQMIGLENCRSLDVVLIAVDEVHRRRLRPVRSAA
jgi:hypothetical protein